MEKNSAEFSFVCAKMTLQGYVQNDLDTFDAQTIEQSITDFKKLALACEQELANRAAKIKLDQMSLQKCPHPHRERVLRAYLSCIETSVDRELLLLNFSQEDIQFALKNEWISVQSEPEDGNTVYAITLV